MKKLIICLFAGCLVSCNNSSNDPIGNRSVETTKNDSIEKTIMEAPEPTAEEKDSLNIEVALNQIEYLPRAKDRTDIPSIENEVDAFKVISNSISYRGDSLIPRVKLLQKKLIQLQKEEFPILRKNYAKAAANRMWEEDVEVNSYDRDIVFTGASFAAHRVIQQSEDAIHDMLLKLRFKSVTFEWIPNASDGTRYILNSKKDTDL